MLHFYSKEMSIHFEQKFVFFFQFKVALAHDTERNNFFWLVLETAIYCSQWQVYFHSCKPTD